MDPVENTVHAVENRCALPPFVDRAPGDQSGFFNHSKNSILKGFFDGLIIVVGESRSDSA
jgi:hypothetical protein